MQDMFPIPSCFTSGERISHDANPVSTTKTGQSLVILMYQTNIAGYCRLVTVTWCKYLFAHGLSVSIDGSDNVDDYESSSNNDSRNSVVENVSKQSSCKVEMSPWNFWRKYGSKRFNVEGNIVDVFWDLRAAKFADQPEPQSDYYVAVISENEVVLLVGDQKKEAYFRTGSRPSILDAVLVSKKEHVFAKKKFSTRAKFLEKGKCHDISVQCSNKNSGGNIDLEMSIKVDGNIVIQVSHLQWKFRGNESFSIDKLRIEVYWDVHDWLFSPGLNHALFIFKPEPPTSSSVSNSCLLTDIQENYYSEGETSGFCLFLYAWKLE